VLAHFSDIGATLAYNPHSFTIRHQRLAAVSSSGSRTFANFSYMTIIYAMIILEKVAGFDWDAGNARKNDHHGVSMAEAEQVFFNVPVLMLPDSAYSQSEPRYHALGKTIDGRRLHISFTLRGDGKLIRVISARDMHRKERAHYEQATQGNT
jgi:uncharacterized protein